MMNSVGQDFSKNQEKMGQIFSSAYLKPVFVYSDLHVHHMYAHMHVRHSCKYKLYMLYMLAYMKCVNAGQLEGCFWARYGPQAAS